MFVDVPGVADVVADVLTDVVVLVVMTAVAAEATGRLEGDVTGGRLGVVTRTNAFPMRSSSALVGPQSMK